MLLDGGAEMFLKSLEELLREILTKRGLSNMVVALILGIIFINLSLFFHEVGHIVTSFAMGCKARLFELNFFTGSSVVGDCASNKLILIALSGGGLAMIYGLWAFFLEKDGLLRIAGIVSFFYSVIPSWRPAFGGDMIVAVNNGLNPILGWIIYLGAMGLVFMLIGKDITEREKYPFI